MAQVILSEVGGAIGGPIGRMIGATIGAVVDQRAVASLEPARQRGPRLDRLKVQGTGEGAPMACVFGRARLAGQVIWAARFSETRNTSSGGKGGPRTVEYAYTLSFAVALCEGVIDGIGRVWADGQPMNLRGVTMRVHRGEANQAPDPLIEAIEVEAPAYRGTAYVVFEDLPLGPYGNRLPQLSFEVFRRPRGEGRLEDRLEGVCLIPGAGEFILATEGVVRREGLIGSKVENLHGGDGRSDLMISLDQLQAQAPNLKRVSLVVGWFGDDLRAGHCTIRPGVESREKRTEPLEWSVAGLDRDGAHLISQSGGGPAYGGTPADETVRQAVTELKARGLEVTLYPFVFMDVPPGNGLEDPYGGGEQAAYPWRGRVRGRDGAEAEADAAAIFGAADGWGLRRLALHYAALVAQTGADGLLIGSEMRGLTWTRDAGGDFPAVAQLRTLASECRAIVGPGVKLSYAADWSEYFGRHAGADAVFHLDPLWSDPAIDYVGVDWYPPLGDWRAEGGGLDAADYAGPDARDYLAAQVAGGENFDWYYASEAARATQVRTPILDGAHGEDWLYRSKDLKGWWSHAHHDRIGGVRSATPTAWVPGMKPIRLTEFGCAAVDRGGNAPNLFLDPKSAESALPPHSTGARDDRMQRRALEAVLGHFAQPENNPVSEIYGGPMLEAADAWCWDARPWPAFPGRDDAWADAGAWRTGHWLNGRLDGETEDLIAALLARAGLDDVGFEIGAVEGAIQGYVVDRPMATRDALEPLLAGLGLLVSEQGGRVAVLGATADRIELDEASLALSDGGASVAAERELEARPSVARVRYIDGAGDYQTGTATVRSDGEGGGVDLDLPAVCADGLARAAAERALAFGGERRTVRLGPLDALRVEPGDVVGLAGSDWRVTRVELDEAPTATLEPLSQVRIGEDGGLPVPGEPVNVAGAPFLRVIELPPLAGLEADARPIAVVAATPWRPMQVSAGVELEALTRRGEVAEPATVGRLVGALEPGLVYRWDERNTLRVRFEGQAPESRSVAAVLAGANALAVETTADWEILQYRTAELEPDGSWRLSGLLRGQQGTEAAMAAGAADGALVVMLNRRLSRVETTGAEVGVPLIWRVGPAGAPVGGFAVREITYAPTGRHGRPWSPAHLRVRTGASGDRLVTWISRSRTDGDRWDGEPAASDPMRFRVRVLDGAEVRRTLEVEAESATYTAAMAEADFPGGPGEDAVIAVAQWGEGHGWGDEARTALP